MSKFKATQIGEKVYIKENSENKLVFSSYILDQKGEIIDEEINTRFDTWVTIKLDNGCILKIHTDDLDFVKFL